MSRNTRAVNWKTPSIALAALAVCGLAAAAGLQTNDADRARNDVLAVDRAWAQAHQAGDRQAMKLTLAEDLRFVHTNGDIDDREKELTRVNGTLETKPEVLDFRTFGDTAIVIGKLHIKRAGATAPPPVVLYTHVYVRRKGVWQMVSHHATDLPHPR